MIVFRTVDKLKVNLYDDLIHAIMMGYKLDMQYSIADKFDVPSMAFTDIVIQNVKER